MMERDTDAEIEATSPVEKIPAGDEPLVEPKTPDAEVVAPVGEVDASEGGASFAAVGKSGIDPRAKAVHGSVLLHLAVILFLLVVAPGPGNRVAADRTLFMDLRASEPLTTDSSFTPPVAPEAPPATPPPVPPPVEPAASVPDAPPAPTPQAMAPMEAKPTEAPAPAAPPVPAPAPPSQTPTPAPAAPPSPAAVPGAQGVGSTGPTGSGALPLPPRYHAHYGTIESTLTRSIYYPRLARQMGWEGKVVVAFTVKTDGGVENVRIVESSGNPVLDRAALDTVNRALPFPPLPSPIDIVSPIVYKLK